MKVLNLRCAQDHRFEGWFSGDDDLQSQLGSGRLTCPLCGDSAVTRLPSAPHLLRAARGDALPPAPAPGPRVAEQAQAEWLRQLRQIMAHTHDVGERFADEARRIHHGEAEARAIRGQATPREAQALAEEGIEVMALPMIPPLKEPLH